MKQRRRPRTRKRPRPVRSPLQKRAKRGFRGFPIASVAYYGPNNRFASKGVVGIVPEEDGEVTALKRWFSEDADIRLDPAVAREMSDFVAEHGAKSVVMADRIIGCPHEEGKDYPLGEDCPQCPYWAGRDPWSGELIGQEDPISDIHVVSACAWYRPEQWDRLLEISVDRDEMADTFEEWQATAEEALEKMRRLGVDVIKVDVDVKELLAWCQEQGREVRGEARAGFASELLRRQQS